MKKSMNKFKIASILMLIHAVVFELVGGCACLFYLLAMSRSIPSDSLLLEIGVKVGISLREYPLFVIFVTLGALGIVTGLIRLHSAIFLFQQKKYSIGIALVINIISLLLMLNIMIKSRAGICELIICVIAIILIWMQSKENTHSALLIDNKTN